MSLAIIKKENPLKELWGFGKGKTKRTTEELIKRAREELKVG